MPEKSIDKTIPFTLMNCTKFKLVLKWYMITVAHTILSLIEKNRHLDTP